MREKFFTVEDSPTTWMDENKKAHPVVNMAPWQHGMMNIGDIQVKGRKAWGASVPIWKNEIIYYNTADYPLISTLSNIVIHHTDNADSLARNENKQQARGYAALGYHFFIDPKGVLYEGRPLEIMGSHAGKGAISGPLNDPDWGAVGIVLQGDFHHKDDWFSSTEVTEKQLTQLEKLIVQLRSKYNINQLLMHREVVRAGKPTDCPGDHLVPYVKKLRNKLKMKGKG